MLDGDLQLSCYNDVNRLRSEARRHGLDQNSIRARLEQLIERYGDMAVGAAKGLLKRDDATVSQHFRAAVERLLQED